MTDFYYQPIFENMSDTTNYRKITDEYVTVKQFEDQEILVIDSKGIELLSKEAFDDISHLLRSSHLEKLGKI